MVSDLMYHLSQFFRFVSLFVRCITRKSLPVQLFFIPRTGLYTFLPFILRSGSSVTVYLDQDACKVFAIAFHNFFLKNLLVSFFSEVILSLFASHFVFYISSFIKRCCTNLAHLYINALFNNMQILSYIAKNERSAHRSSDRMPIKFIRRHLNMTDCTADKFC